jgi:hypothetical protein
MLGFFKSKKCFSFYYFLARKSMDFIMFLIEKKCKLLITFSRIDDRKVCYSFQKLHKMMIFCMKPVLLKARSKVAILKEKKWWRPTWSNWKLVKSIVAILISFSWPALPARGFSIRILLFG